jgi:glyoxylase-like metal-dependent hydrolase (beta-lactamase superfamily II)
MTPMKKSRLAELTVLYEGYVRESKGGELVRNTVCLVRDGKLNIIVDPGLLNSPSTLVRALRKVNLKPSDITHVYITHYHMDHVRYVGLFPDARVVDYKYEYKGELWGEHGGDGHKLSENITIIHTPGHTMDDSALLVRTEEGVIAISHVWWFPDRSPLKDPMAVDQGLLEESRKKVESQADSIITPHGGRLIVRVAK